jgi:hypothetical protein
MGGTMRVIVQLRTSSSVHDAAVSGQPAPALTLGLEQAIDGLTFDPSYPPVQVP